jgi:hypothetical protein
MTVAAPADTATVIVTRDLCDVSYDLVDIRRSIEDAENALIDAHSDLRPAAEVIAEMVAVREAFDRVIAEAVEIAGGTSAILSKNALVLDTVGARR